MGYAVSPLYTIKPSWITSVIEFLKGKKNEKNIKEIIF